MAEICRLFRYKRTKCYKIHLSPPKKKEENEIPFDGGHYIRSEIDNVDLKKSNLARNVTAKNITKEYRNIARKTPYKVPNVVLEEPSNAEDIDRVDTIEILDDIDTFQPVKNAQLAAKKISKKRKKGEKQKTEKANLSCLEK